MKYRVTGEYELRKWYVVEAVVEADNEWEAREKAIEGGFNYDNAVSEGEATAEPTRVLRVVEEK